MRKIIFFVGGWFIFCLPAVSANIPLFKIPSNSNYKLFNYSPSDVIKLQKENKLKNLNVLPKENLTLKKMVKGIFVTKEGNWALIGTSICKKGDKIDGYEIESISEDKIIFSKDGRKIVVVLGTPLSRLDNATESKNPTK